jgi:hypothetical protein
MATFTEWKKVYSLNSRNWLTAKYRSGALTIPSCSEAGARCYVKPTEREWLAVEYFSKLLVAGVTYSVPIADADDWVAIVAAASPEQPWIGQRISGDELEASHPNRRFFQVLHTSPYSLPEGKALTKSAWSLKNCRGGGKCKRQFRAALHS